MIVSLCFSLLLSTLVESNSTTCPQGQVVARDGTCTDPSNLKFVPLGNITTADDGKNLFDTRVGCSPGTALAHDGKCINPFNLAISDLKTPDVTVTTPSSEHKQQTPRTSQGNSSARETTNRTFVRTTRRPNHTIYIRRQKIYRCHFLKMQLHLVIVVIVVLAASLCGANPVRNIIDTPDGCPEGYEKAHDGSCIEPFELILPALRALQNLQVFH